MFRTVQSNPGIVTIFHNAKSPVSTHLLRVLQGAAKSNKFDLEVHREYPTRDQFQTIKDYKGTNIGAVFPKPPRPETWGASLEDAAEGGFFVGSLVVDWEHSTVAGDEEELKRLLKVY